MQDRGHYESFICKKVRDNLTELFLNKLIVIGFGKWETLGESLLAHVFPNKEFFWGVTSGLGVMNMRRQTAIAQFICMVLR